MSVQEKTKIRTICIDGDCIPVTFHFDEQWQVWIGEYPFFKEEPRYTPSGRPWRNVTFAECPYHGNPQYNDCGSCPMLKKQSHRDLIGVCYREELRQIPPEDEQDDMAG